MKFRHAGGLALAVIMLGATGSAMLALAPVELDITRARPEHMQQLLRGLTWWAGAGLGLAVASVFIEAVRRGRKSAARRQGELAS